MSKTKLSNFDSSLYALWMMLSNYRSSQEHREILRILQKSTTLEENFVWQTNALGRRLIPIHHFEIDFVLREVVIFYDSSKFRIENDLALYVKLDYRSSVFKVENFRFRQNSVQFSFPAEVKTLELRENPRFIFKAEQEKYVGLRPSMMANMAREAGGTLNARVLDISEYGLGLMVSENNRSFVKNNRILWVTSLQGVPLEYPILAEVMYINSEIDPKLQLKKRKDLKVGLKLSSVFPADSVQQFLH